MFYQKHLKNAFLRQKKNTFLCVICFYKTFFKTQKSVFLKNTFWCKTPNDFEKRHIILKNTKKCVQKHKRWFLAFFIKHFFFSVGTWVPGLGLSTTETPMPSELLFISAVAEYYSSMTATGVNSLTMLRNYVSVAYRKRYKGHSKNNEVIFIYSQMILPSLDLVLTIKD